MKQRHFNILVSLLSSSITSAGMLLENLWCLVIFGLAIFFYLLWEKVSSTKQAGLIGFIFGFITSGAGLISLWEIIPISTQEHVLANLSTAVFLWTVPTFALGITTVPIAILAYRTRGNAFRSLIAATLLVLNEVLKMWAWAIITFGPGAVFEPHLTIAGLGYALADNNYLLQLAWFGGFFGLTISLSTFSATLAEVCLLVRQSVRKNVQTLSVAVAFSLLLLLLPLLSLYDSQDHKKNLSSSIHLAVIHTDRRGDGHLTQFKAPETNVLPDVVVFPEGKPPTLLHPDMRALYDNWHMNNPDLLTIHSELSSRDGRRFNTILFQIRGEVVASQDKRFIMPQGEYLPFLSSYILPRLGTSAIGSVTNDTSLTHGNSLTSVEVNKFKVGVLLCSEIFSPFLYRNLATTEGSTVLVNLGDSTWFRGSKALYRKTVQIAKVHAVQNRAYFVAAQNRSPSFVIDPFGNLLSESGWESEEILFVTISR